MWVHILKFNDFSAYVVKIFILRRTASQPGSISLALGVLLSQYERKWTSGIIYSTVSCDYFLKFIGAVASTIAIATERNNGEANSSGFFSQEVLIITKVSRTSTERATLVLLKSEHIKVHFVHASVRGTAAKGTRRCLKLPCLPALFVLVNWRAATNDIWRRSQY